MKLVTAVLAPERLEAVAAALAQVEVFRMTVTECRGVGRGADGTGFGTAPQLKAKLEIAVNEDFVQPTMEAIQTAGLLTDVEGGTASTAMGETPTATGETQAEGPFDAGFGKIFLTELLDVVRIRTGERGPEAI